MSFEPAELLVPGRVLRTLTVCLDVQVDVVYRVRCDRIASSSRAGEGSKWNLNVLRVPGFRGGKVVSA